MWRIPCHEIQHAVRGVDTFRGIHHNNRACHVRKITSPYGTRNGSIVPLDWSMNGNIRIDKLFMRSTMGDHRHSCRWINHATYHFTGTCYVMHHGARFPHHKSRRYKENYRETLVPWKKSFDTGSISIHTVARVC